MNKLIVLILLCIALVNCDGRDRVFKTTEEALIENKLLDSFSESIKYFPEHYSETETDTILSNGFKVKIKTITDMENNYLDEFKQDSITHKHYYRDLKSIITITHNKVVFEEQIDKDFILNLDSEFESLAKESVLSNVWLDQEKSLSNSNSTINILYCKPETDWCTFFRLIVDKDGQFSLQDVTEEMEEGL